VPFLHVSIRELSLRGVRLALSQGEGVPSLSAWARLFRINATVPPIRL